MIKTVEIFWYEGINKKKFSTKTYAVGTQKNCLNDMVLLSIQKHMLKLKDKDISKILFIWTHDVTKSFFDINQLVELHCALEVKTLSTMRRFFCHPKHIKTYK